MKIVNDFDKVAAFYDGLAEVVFGKTLLIASTYFFNQIQPGSRVLIVGGGTGRILSYLPDGSEVDYMELSKGMIDQAKKVGSFSVNFMHGDFLKAELNKKYDVIIFSFFLDVFDSEHLKQAIHKSKGLLKVEGILLVTDFQQPTSLLQKVLIRLMLIFFRVSVNLEAKDLQEIKFNLFNISFQEIESRNFYRGMIFSSIFKHRETF